MLIRIDDQTIDGTRKRALRIEPRTFSETGKGFGQLAPETWIQGRAKGRLIFWYVAK